MGLGLGVMGRGEGGTRTCHKDSGMRGRAWTAVTSLIREYLCIFIVMVGPWSHASQNLISHTHMA